MLMTTMMKILIFRFLPQAKTIFVLVLSYKSLSSSSSFSSCCCYFNVKMVLLREVKSCVPDTIINNIFEIISHVLGEKIFFSVNLSYQTM